MMIKAVGSPPVVGTVPVHAMKAYRGSRGTAPLTLQTLALDGLQYAGTFYQTTWHNKSEDPSI